MTTSSQERTVTLTVWFSDLCTPTSEAMRVVIEFPEISWKISPALFTLSCVWDSVTGNLLMQPQLCESSAHYVEVWVRKTCRKKKLTTTSTAVSQICMIEAVPGHPDLPGNTLGEMMDSVTVPVKEYMADYPIRSFCFARCVLYTIFSLYLAHLSLCHHLGAALQSVIYVYRWPCGQEGLSEFTQVIRPLDRSEVREKHISSLNGVSFLEPNFLTHLSHLRTSYFLLEPFILYHVVIKERI